MEVEVACDVRAVSRSNRSECVWLLHKHCGRYYNMIQERFISRVVKISELG